MPHPSDVLERITWRIQYLAKPNDAFHDTFTGVHKNNGKFLGLVKIISKFDKMLHMIRANNNETNDH